MNDKILERIEITEVAEEDFKRDIPPEDLNILINAINGMNREDGKDDFLELATEPEHNIYYADHTVS